MIFLKTYEQFTSSDIKNFILDFGIFITLNLSQVQQQSIDNVADTELKNMLNNLRKPLINGKTYAELTNDLNKIVSDPKYLSVLLSQIRGLLIYIEPRIKKYVKDCNFKNNWLMRIEKFKETYKNIIK